MARTTTGEGSETPTPLPGSTTDAAPGQSPDTIAKQGSEPNSYEQDAAKAAQAESQKAADEAAEQARKVTVGEVAAPVKAPFVTGEDAGVAKFAAEQGFNGAEAGLLKAILQARRDGTVVPSVAFNQMPDDRVEAVGVAADEYVKQRSESAIDTPEDEGVTKAKEKVEEAKKALAEAQRDARAAAAKTATKAAEPAAV